MRLTSSTAPADTKARLWKKTNFLHFDLDPRSFGPKRPYAILLAGGKFPGYRPKWPGPFVAPVDVALGVSPYVLANLNRVMCSQVAGKGPPGNEKE